MCVCSCDEILYRALANCFVVLSFATIALLPAEATAQGLFEHLFGGLRRAPAPQATTSNQPLGYANPLDLGTKAPTQLRSVGSSMSYCVRLCDGRYFPIPRIIGASPIQRCNALCPASPTKVYSGSEIGHAVARDGTRYTALENAFLYRKRLVSTCTCNGKDSFGLARVDINADPTVQSGDIVTTENGRMALSSSRSKRGDIQTVKSY